MKRVSMICLLGLVLGAMFPFQAAAESHGMKGMKGEILAQIDDLEKKLVGLAEAMPEDKYTWQPAEGVRSVGAVYLHIASANYFFGGLIGTPAPEGINPSGLEKSVTGKAATVDALKKSIAHARQAVNKLSHDDFHKELNLFGRDSTIEGALLVVVRHMSEHLGQSIAYARMNGVAPPWSQ